MTPRPLAIVAGAGIFGVTAALELDRRGWAVTLIDPGPIPHPLAASTDISKVCRMEYGPDELYTELMERARDGWLDWNRRWRRDGRDALYHETGVLMVCLDPMAPDGFEYESFRALERRGHAPERLGGPSLVERFPAWSEAFVDGFFHAVGGWVESGRVVARLAAEARHRGIAFAEGQRVVGVEPARGGGAKLRVTLGPGSPSPGSIVRGSIVDGSSARGSTGTSADDPTPICLEANAVVLAGGSWVGGVLPELAGSLVQTYHPVWHLRPRDPEAFRADRFPVFTADVARTGFYGFPLHPREGVVKMGHHGTGVKPVPEESNLGGNPAVSPMPPSTSPPASLTVPAEITERLFAFLAENFPSLANAELVGTRLCPYCDTPDEDFWIARHPELPALTVASGGSGHAFKFAPVLGTLVADVVEGTFGPDSGRVSERFRWRPDLRLERGREAARCHETSW